MKMTTVSLVWAVSVCLGILGVTASAVADDECLTRPPVLTIGIHTLALSENRPVCVKPEGNFRIKLKALPGYTLDANKIKIKAKRGFTRIEDVIVDSENWLHVEVGKFAPDTVHAYWIKVDDVGVLDPRVRINTNAFAYTAAMESMESYTLNNFDISLQELLAVDQHLRDEFHTNISDVISMLQASTESMTESE